VGGGGRRDALGFVGGNEGGGATHRAAILSDCSVRYSLLDYNLLVVSEEVHTAFSNFEFKRVLTVCLL